MITRTRPLLDSTHRPDRKLAIVGGPCAAKEPGMVARHPDMGPVLYVTDCMRHKTVTHMYLATNTAYHYAGVLPHGSVMWGNSHVLTPWDPDRPEDYCECTPCMSGATARAEAQKAGLVDSPFVTAKDNKVNSDE